MNELSARPLAVALIALLPQLAAPQTARRDLGPPTASLAEDFTRIGSIRVLSDGRVLIADTGDDRLVIADLRTGRVTRLGSVGAGPREYEGLGRIFELASDSTLLLDAGSGARWLLLSGDSIVATVTVTDSAVRVARTAIHGASRDGSVLGARTTFTPVDAAGVRRSDAVLLRIRRATGSVDSVTTVRGRSVGLTSLGESTIAMEMTYSVPEPALLFPDGWIAVARQRPYRVEWYPPHAAKVVGPELPWSAPRVDDAEKAAWAVRSKAAGSRFPLTVEQLPWADVVPPYVADALQATPSGDLLVRRAVWSGSRGNEYDLIDRAGVRQESFSIPSNERIVGFAPGAVFVAVADPDGLEQLRRYRWP